jgi:DNA repair protein RecO (recombination protein O)
MCVSAANPSRGDAEPSAPQAELPQGARQLGGQQLLQLPALHRCLKLRESTQQLAAEQHLRKAHQSCSPDQLSSCLQVACQVDLGEGQPVCVEQTLCARAERAEIRCVEGQLIHYYTKYSGPVCLLDSSLMGPVKTEAVVLRSMRFGEADRILHLYTPQRGRVGAIAKGVRKARSRFGGRLEPFFRVRLELHEGRGELLTVTGAHTISGHPRLRESSGALDAAARACDAVGRLFETPEPNPGVFNLLCRKLSLLDEDPASATQACALAFRLKLLLAAGLTPQLAACANCGEQEHLVGFSGAVGGIVCAACEAGSFPLAEEAYSFMLQSLRCSLAKAPEASRSALAQADRAISEMLEHHANLRLMPSMAKVA